MAETNFWKRLEAVFSGAGDHDVPPPSRVAPDAPVASDAPAAPDASPAGLSAFMERIPGSARERVDRIIETIATLEARLGKDSRRVMEAAELHQMASDHLPKLLLSYINIPAEHRAEIFRTTGRSASFMLNDQLDRVIAHLHTVSRAIAQDDIDIFSTNIGFIGSRYGANPFVSD